jgi:ligand-binding sensor domain-containing protein
MTIRFKTPLLKIIRFCCKPLIFSFVIINCSFGLFGQEFSLRQYSIPEGLVQTQVWSLYQDSKGFLWIGTKGGISRFDGEEFVNFTVKDGLADNLVRFFYENHEGVLFIALRQGMAIYSDGKLQNIQLPDSNLVYLTLVYENSLGKTFLFFANRQNHYQIYEFADGRFTSAQQYFRNLIAKLVTDTLVENGFHDKASHALYGRVNKRIIKIQDQQVQWVGQSEKRITDIKFENKSLYYSTDKDIFVLSNGINSKIILPENFLSEGSTNIYAFEVDNKGGIYFTNDRFHLNYFDGNELVTNLKEFVGNSKLLIDKEGTLWIGGEGGDGLFSLESTAFINYLPEKNGIPKNVWSIVEDKNGKIWFGGYNEGLVMYDSPNFERYGFPFLSKRIQTILPGGILTKGNNALFSTDIVGIICYDGVNFTQYLAPEFFYDGPLIIYEDTVGHKVLFGTSGGKLIIKSPDRSLKSLDVAKPKGALSIVSISMDEKNRYWIGYFRGMTIVDGEEYSVLPNEECDFNLGASCQ